MRSEHWRLCGEGEQLFLLARIKNTKYTGMVPAACDQACDVTKGHTYMPLGLDSTRRKEINRKKIKNQSQRPALYRLIAMHYAAKSFDMPKPTARSIWVQPSFRPCHPDTVPPTPHTLAGCLLVTVNVSVFVSLLPARFLCRCLQVPHPSPAIPGPKPCTLSFTRPVVWLVLACTTALEAATCRFVAFALGGYPFPAVHATPSPC